MLPEERPQLCITAPPVSGVSESTAAFVRERLGSIEQIEIVLFLRAHQESAWTTAEVAKELGTAPQSATMRLFLLASNGIVTPDGGSPARYRYVPSGDATQSMIDEVAGLYAERPIDIVKAMEAPAPDPARTFADAFRLKKKE